MKTNTTPRDNYQAITDRFIAAIEAAIATGAALPWVKPWSTGCADYRNACTGKRYNGINLLILGLSGYTDPRWLTFNQAKKLGGHVRQGEKGTAVVFWKLFDQEDKEGKETGKKIPFLKTYTVFNVAQIEGVTFAPITAGNPQALEKNEKAEGLIENAGATITYGGDRACYSPTADAIRLPIREAFKTAAGFYGTAFHELAHWTGHSSRLARDFSGRFGDEAYAFEELVAELAAAFLCQDCRIDGQLQHEGYLANWLQILKNDKKAMISAASQATKAARLLNPTQANQEDEEEANG